MPGTLFLVVGPSGVGKDSLINGVRVQELPGLHFPRRVITRPKMDDSEDFEPIAPEAFETQDFAVSWPAHGLMYGLRHAAFAPLNNGEHVVLNVSRKLIEQFETMFASVVVVNITAPIDVLAQRLADRGREDIADIRQRLSRSVDVQTHRARLVKIDNSGDLNAGVATLTQLILAYTDKG